MSPFVEKCSPSLKIYSSVNETHQDVYCIPNDSVNI